MKRILLWSGAVFAAMIALTAFHGMLDDHIRREVEPLRRQAGHAQVEYDKAHPPARLYGLDIVREELGLGQAGEKAENTWRRDHWLQSVVDGVLYVLAIVTGTAIKQTPKALKVFGSYLT